MSLSDYLKSLQAKPYQERTRILWISTIIVAIVLLGIWVSLIKFQNAGNSGRSFNPFGYFTDLVDNAKSRLTQFQDSGGTSSPEAEIALTNFSTDTLNKTLTVVFTVKNSGTDILSFPENITTGITLADGSETLFLKKITGPDSEPFPKRILSNTEISGQLVFPLPQNQIVTINIANLAFMQNPQSTFAKILTLDLNSRNVRGLFETKYPRD